MFTLAITFQEKEAEKVRKFHDVHYKKYREVYLKGIEAIEKENREIKK